MRPIDADELHPIELDLMLAVPYEDIKDAPTVDTVEVVHGHWNCNVLFYGTHTCSNCGKDPIHYDGRTGYVEILSDYCPNCGAKMDEVNE